MTQIRSVYRSSAVLPPNMSDLRVVLLGKSVSENRRVGNFILGRAAFDSEAPPDVVDIVRQRLKDRHVMIIHSPQLLQTNISDHQITLTVGECVYISDPGPHAFIIILQYKDFTEEDMRRVKHVLEKFNEEAFKHTLVITSDEETYESHTSPTINHIAIHQLIKECGGRHMPLGKQQSEWQSDIFNTLEKMLKGNHEEHLTREIYVETSVDEEQSRSEDGNEESLQDRQYEKHKESTDEGNFHRKQKLNLVLCGSDGSLTASVSKVLRGKNIIRCHQKERNKVRKKKHIINDRQICLVELPALIGLSEEEVMHQTLTCVSLCDPGVHLFLFILTDSSLTDEDKLEIEKIQKIFDSREHFMPFFTSVQVTDLVKSSPESQRLISCCGGQYWVMGLNEPEMSRKITELLDYIENMTNEPYSLQMYVKAQENRARCEVEEQYVKERKIMEDEIKELKQKILSYGAEGEADDQECLRIVLIGKTGNGKSATGNTILGKNKFESKSTTNSVTTVCMKEVGEVDGRSVAVVDTPGLFDTTLSNDHVVEEIVKCVSLSSPGPHAFVIVLSVGRFTKEETETVDLIKKIFGHKSAQFSIILFTRGDDLENESIQDYVNESESAELQKLIRDCGNRFLAFNNREKQDKTQVIQLLNMIEEVKKTNEGRYYTNSMFEEAEMSIKKKMEQILKERDKEIQVQKEELRAIYEMDMKNLKKKLEEEKKRADEEKIKMHNQFTEKMEKLRKEFEEKEITEQEKREIENKKRSEEEKQKRAEYDQKIEEMKREIENQRSQYEKQQRQREEDDRKREEKYKQEQEKMKHEQERLTELQMRHEEETKRRESEEKMRNKEEEEERQRWERKIKEAENERKETQEEILRQQREWEDEKIQQMREREEEERKRKEKHEEQLREKQEELEEMREIFAKERDKERQKIPYERNKQRREQEEKEREYEEKTSQMKRHYEQLEQNRKMEWEKRKQEDDDRREDERRRLAKIIESFKQVRELEISKRHKEEKEKKEREEKELDEITKNYEEKIKFMMKKLQDDSRKQAEEFNDFRERKEQHVQELQQMLEEHQKQQTLLEKLCHHLKDQTDEEIQDLLLAVDSYNKKCSCVIL